MPWGNRPQAGPQRTNRGTYPPSSWAGTAPSHDALMNRQAELAEPKGGAGAFFIVAPALPPGPPSRGRRPGTCPAMGPPHGPRRVLVARDPTGGGAQRRRTAGGLRYPSGHAGARREPQPGGKNMPKTDLLLAATFDADRYRGMERRHAFERALREDARHEPIWTRLLARFRPEHSLTPYPCRLPSGEMGRSAIKFLEGEWTAVCVPAPRERVSAGQAAVPGPASRAAAWLS